MNRRLLTCPRCKRSMVMHLDDVYDVMDDHEGAVLCHHCLAVFDPYQPPTELEQQEAMIEREVEEDDGEALIS